MAAAQDTQTRGVHARRLVVDDADDLVGRARAREPHVRRGPRRGHDARLAVQRLLRAHAGAEDRAVRGQHRLDAVLHRARRAGHRQAAALGEADVDTAFYNNDVADRAGDGRPRPPRRARDDPRPHLRLLHRGDVGLRSPRHHRRGQRDGRDRLPAQRHHVARLHRRRQEAPRRTCPRRTQYKILRGNAERLFRFEPAAPPVAVPA